MTHDDQPYRIAGIEDDYNSRPGLLATLEALEPEGYAVVGVFPSFEDFNEARVGVDLVVLDRWIRRPEESEKATGAPEPLSGHHAVAELRKRSIRVIMHTMDTNPGHAILEMAAGADAIVDKSYHSPEPLYDAIRASRSGTPLITTAPVARSVWESVELRKSLVLTPREKSVLKWKVAGLSLDQIARREHISEKTVQAAVTQINKKIQTVLTLTNAQTGSEKPVWLQQLLAGFDPMRQRLDD